MATGVDVVQRYLRAVVAHDWAAVGDCLTSDVVRTGPFGDRYTPRQPYVRFLAELMPTLPGYAMEVRGVSRLDDGRVLAELSETVELEGSPHVTHEVLVFALDGDVIRHIDIYIQRSVPG